MRVRLDNGEVVSGDLAFRLIVMGLGTPIRSDEEFETADIQPKIEEAILRNYRPK